jgi:SAM-dependent methyltransferase
MCTLDYAQIAHLYDAYVKTEFDASFFLQETRGCARVLEVMCGTGRVSIPLLQAGVPLTCVDNSRPMLSLLHEKFAALGLSASVHEMDVRALRLQRQFDRIIIPFNAFAELVRPEDQRQALARIYDHLEEDGRFICTLHNPTVRLRDVDGRLHPRGEHPLPDGGVLFLSTIERYDEASHLVIGTQFYQVRNAQGVIQRDLSLDVRFYLHDRHGFEVLFRSAGFASAALYGDYARSAFEPQQSPFMIWILTKGPPVA